MTERLRRTPAAVAGPRLSTRGLSIFPLKLGPQRFLAELSDPHEVSLIDDDYLEFRETGAGSTSPPVELHFFAGEEEIRGWRDAEEILATVNWRLRRGRRGLFVVGTAFDPPQPFWVAAGDAALSRFAVARLESPVAAPKHVIDAALRIVPRLVLMHRLLAPPTGVLVHCAGARIGGSMLLFPGVSGAGKSTMSRLILEHGAGEVANDERMLLTRRDDEWTAWGTPWPGELGIAHNQHGALGGVVFLEKSDRTRAEPLSPQDALARLIPVVSIPWYDGTLTSGALDLCHRLVAEVPVHLLHFRPDESAVAAVRALAPA